MDYFGLTIFEGDELRQLASELIDAAAHVGPEAAGSLGVAGRAIGQLGPHVSMAVFHGI